ncbi:MAG: glycosyltransferase family 9 protein [archaeon]
MKKSLIIKLGALGDVVRTTTILNVIDGDITWFTKENAKPLLENISQVSHIASDVQEIRGKYFDTVYNLDDDLEGCEVLDSISYGRLYGFYACGGKVLPMPEAFEWWGMSLNGLSDRDERKQANRKSFQYYLFNNICKTFNGEDYVFGYRPNKVTENIIGLESRAGDRWPMKIWPFYSELEDKLKSCGYEIRIFEQRDDIRDYIRDVNSCRLVVTGDSLAMHIALALKKKAVSIFGPTSPWEIEMYDRGKKLYADMDCISCFRKSNCDVKPNCMESISVDQVYGVIEELLK